jgi:hypothetical protein
MTAARYHLAQYNIATLVAPLDDPRLADFVASLDRINQLGDRSPGFVWRHQAEDGNSTSIRVRGDDRILINFTVWESVETLFEYAFHSDHVEVYRRRKEWFEHDDLPYAVLWWIPAGHIPTVAEADARLDYLREHGPSARAFTFKQRFSPPDADPADARDEATVASN